MASKQKRTLEILTVARDQTATAFRSVQRRAIQFAARMKRIGASAARAFFSLRTAVLGVGTALATFAGARAFGQILGDLDELSKTARRLNLPVDAFNELRFAADLAGVEARTFENGIRNLSTRVNEAARGQQRYAQLFTRLGVEIRRSDGSLRSTESILADLADAYRRLPEGIERAALMTELFGQRNSRLSTLLEGGSQGIQKMRREAAFFVGSVADAGSTAEDFNDSLTRLRASLLSVFRGAAIAAADKLTETFNKLATFIAENRQAFVDFFISAGRLAAEFFRGVINSLQSISNLVKDIGLVAGGRLNPFRNLQDQIKEAAARSAELKKQLNETKRELASVEEQGRRATDATVSNAAIVRAKELKREIAGIAKELRDSIADELLLQQRSDGGAGERFLARWKALTDRYKAIGKQAGQEVSRDLSETIVTATPIARNFWEGFKFEATQAFEAIDQEFQRGRDFFRTFEQNSTRALAGFISGTSSAKEAWEDFARSMLNAIAQMIAQMLVLRALSAVFSFFGPAPGAAAGGSAGAAAGGAASSAFTGGFSGGAAGGAFGGATSALGFGGESASLGGVTINVNVNQNVTHPDGEAFGRILARNADKVAAVTARQIQERPEIRAAIRG